MVFCFVFVGINGGGCGGGKDNGSTEKVIYVALETNVKNKQTNEILYFQKETQ